MSEEESYTAVQFVEWAVDRGHYPVVDMYDNFLKYKQYEKEIKQGVADRLHFVEDDAHGT